MLGWYDRAVESFIKQLGDDVWREALLAAAGRELLPWCHSDSVPAGDAATLALFCSAAQATMLDTTPHQLLEEFGEYFVSYLTEQGYSNLLRTLGTNLLEFLQNLNDLHLHLGLMFPAMAAPAFKCTDVGPTCLTLHYHSHRPALGPIVVGVLKGLAEQYWGLVSGQLQVELLRGRGDGGSEDYDNDVFRVSYPYQTALEQWEPPVSVGNHQNASASAATFPAAAARSFTLSPESFYQLFPFHLLLDRSCRVVQAGSVLERLFPELQGRSGVPLGDVFQMRAPCMSISYESLHAAQADTVLLRAHTTGLDMKGQVLVVRTRASSQPGAKGGGPVQVGAERGQHQPQQAGAEPQQALQGEPTERVQGEEEGLLFLGSPWLAGLAGMRQHGIFISDIPRHDATRDFVMLAEQRHAEAQLKERLESLTLELKEANSRLGEMTGWLDEERRRSDGLLYQMLPPEVASCLKNEERAPAREHPEATVLFSDIVGFTEIASRSSPLEVCSLLDELYQRFDAAIEEHPQLYKVETIGDAYMVVCNVTVPCDDHADVLLEFALRMHEEASLVASSLGEPVRIRVGMHSGPVVAGVVGRKMPRFCLFGDTVNTASRMESHGEAGKIHISEACYSCLRAKERFLIRERGNITVKGKGTMRTYLLSPSEQSPGDSSPFAPQLLPQLLPQLHISCTIASPSQPLGQQECLPSSCLECLLQESRSVASQTGGYLASSPRRATQPAMIPDDCTSIWARALTCWEAAPISTAAAAGVTAAPGSSPGVAGDPWRAAAGPSSCPLLLPGFMPGRRSADAVREGHGIHSRPVHVPATPQSGAPAVARPGPSSSSGGQEPSSTSCGLVGLASPPGAAATATAVAAAAAARVTTYLDVSAEMLTHISNARSAARSAGGGALTSGFSWSGAGGRMSLSSPLSPRTCTPRHTQSAKATPPPGMRVASSSATLATLAAGRPPSLVAARSGLLRQEAWGRPGSPTECGRRDMFLMPGTAEDPCPE